MALIIQELFLKLNKIQTESLSSKIPQKKLTFSLQRVALISGRNSNIQKFQNKL